MCPVPVGVCWPDVSPSILVHSSDVRRSRAACAIGKLSRVITSSTSNIVYRQENRQYDNGEGYEDNEEGL